MSAQDLTVRRMVGAVVPGQPGPVDIEVNDGRISAITASSSAQARPGIAASPGVVDASGRLVLPGFVESHLHLDKALLGQPEGGADLAGAIAETARRKAAFTVEEVMARGEQVLEWAARAGTTAVRAQTEIDPGVGLVSIEAISALAERWASRIDVEIAVFPQEGILARPGTWELMAEALRGPRRVLGGCPYSEATVEDARAHVDRVLDLAAELGVPVDFHLDLADSVADPRFALAGYVAQATALRQMHGRVAISHASTLGVLPDDVRARTLDQLAQAQVTVVLLPATDLYLNGRSGYPSNRGLPPLKELWAHGVPTSLSSNNVRNAFTPTGRANLLDIALLLARVAHLSSDAELARVLEDATVGGARLLAPGRPVGVEVGAPADLVLLDASGPAEAVLDQTPPALVIKGGRTVLRETQAREVWVG
jgi:cytosine deaminase